MSDDAVMRLLEEFVAARARGERPDVRDYLERAGPRAGELGALVEGALAALPPPPPSGETVAMMEALLADEPALVALRHRGGLTVDQVTDGLARRFQVAPADRPRLRALYQRLEAGLLDLAAAAGGLRTALADILGVEPGEIVAARTPGGGAVFARGPEGWEAAMDELPVDDLPGPPSPALDRLFGLGG